MPIIVTCSPEVASEVAQAIFGAEQKDIDATEALQGKFAGVVVTTSAGQPCAGEDIRDRKKNHWKHPLRCFFSENP